MISKIVEEQLKKCCFADLGNFDANTNTFYIKKYTKPKYDLGKCYLIKVSREIIKNPKTVLATNWNNGTAPQHEYYKAYVSKVLGTYVYCDCLAFDWETKQDINIMYSGWFNLDNLTQIAVL